MELSSDLINLMIRFGFNLSIAFIIIKLIYQRNRANNLDFVFTYFMFNSLIFFFAYLLGNITNLYIGLPEIKQLAAPKACGLFPLNKSQLFLR